MRDKYIVGQKCNNLNEISCFADMIFLLLILKFEVLWYIVVWWDNVPPTLQNPTAKGWHGQQTLALLWPQGVEIQNAKVWKYLLKYQENSNILFQWKTYNIECYTADLYCSLKSTLRAK